MPGTDAPFLGMSRRRATHPAIYLVAGCAVRCAVLRGVPSTCCVSFYAVLLALGEGAGKLSWLLWTTERVAPGCHHLSSRQNGEGRGAGTAACGRSGITHSAIPIPISRPQVVFVGKARSGKSGLLPASVRLPALRAARQVFWSNAARLGNHRLARLPARRAPASRTHGSVVRC